MNATPDVRSGMLWSNLSQYCLQSYPQIVWKTFTRPFLTAVVNRPLLGKRTESQIFYWTNTERPITRCLQALCNASE